MSHKIKEQTSSFLFLFCQELGMLFNGGIALSDAFYLMKENAVSSKEAQLYHTLAESTQQGSPLSLALSQTGHFPIYMVRMVHIGENSGKMEEVLSALTLFYRRQEQLRGNIKNAIVYPAIMVLVMLLILAILMIKVLPVFAQVFDQVGAQLPAVIQTLAHSSHIITLVCIIGLVLLAVLFIAYYLAKNTPKGTQYLNRFSERLPFVRTLKQRSGADDFIYSMSLLLSSGIPLDQAVNTVEELTISPFIKEKISLLQKRMEEGTAFPRALADAGLLLPKYAAMVAAGLNTGHLDEAMNVVAQHSGEDTSSWVDRIISGIEPVIVIFMCLIIGAVLMSVMLPLIKIMTSM